jgi:hypothetical protein
MRKATLTCTALVLSLQATIAHAQQVAPFKLTDVWAYLELSYRLDQINNKSTGVETDVDDDRRQIEFGFSSTSYVYHPKLLHMRIGGSLLSDRQRIDRELSSLAAGSVDVSSSSRKDLLFNMDATLRFLKDKPFPTTFSYVRDNPIVSTGVEGSFTQETERMVLDFQLRDVIPFYLALNASKGWAFGESLDRVTDNSTERVNVKARKTFSPGNRMTFDFDTSVQESRNGDPRRPIQETIRKTERVLLTTASRLGSDDQVRFDQTLRLNRRDEPDVTDISYAPLLRWIHSPSWESTYRYDFNQSERPESDFKNTAEALSALVRYIPTSTFDALIRAEYNRSEDVDRLSQDVRAISGQANIKHDSAAGRLNLSLGLGYRLDDRNSQSPRVIIEEEPVTFIGSAPIPLSRDFVLAETIVVNNDTGTQTYIEGVDYLVSVIGSTTRIERVISGSILDGETVLVDYEAETGGTFEYSQVNQSFSADYRFAKYHNLFFRYHNSRQNLQSGTPTLPFNSVESFEIGLREDIPIRTRGIQISGEAKYRRQEEDINPYDQTSFTLSVQAPLSAKTNVSASASRSVVDNFFSDEDSDLTSYNANITWRALRSLTLRADGHYDKDTGGTVFRSNTRWKVAAQWRYRRISLRVDTRYNRQRQGDLDNDHYEFWVQIRREMF